MKTNQTTNNFNLSLKSSTPLQALEAKALKARAIALAKAAGKKEDPKTKDKKKRAKELTPIERSLRNLERAVQGWKLDGRAAAFERGKGDTAACATISIFKVDAAKKEEFMAERQGDAKPRAEKRYVFYPDPLMPSRLGSVAIYGKEARETLEAVAKAGHIFGHRIRCATVEFGCRPFVDVKFSKF
ncbi:MAG: hypothetical protein NC102_07150 [Clostridium sp.]|nr:hypothetical protein [Clostridium sp.]